MMQLHSQFLLLMEEPKQSQFIRVLDYEMVKEGTEVEAAKYFFSDDETNSQQYRAILKGKRLRKLNSEQERAVGMERTEESN